MGLPNELGVGRINRLLSRLLQIKGGSPAPVLVPELQATLLLESDRLEWEWLKGAQLFGRRRVVNAAVPTFSSVELVNPALSGALATIIAVGVMTNAVAVELELDAGAGLGGTAEAGTALDSRMPTSRQSVLTTQVLTTGASGVANGIWRLGLDQQLIVPRGLCVLAPGSLMRMAGTSVNAGFALNVIWIERAIEQSELG